MYKQTNYNIHTNKKQGNTHDERIFNLDFIEYPSEEVKTQIF